MHVALICDFPLRTLAGALQLPPETGFATPIENLVTGFLDSTIPQRLSVVSVKKTLKRDAVIKFSPSLSLYLLRAPRFSGMPVAFLPRVARIGHLLRRLKPDLVHGQGTERENAIAAVRSGFPSLVTVHGILREVHEVTKPPTLSANRVGRLTEDYVFNKVLNVIAISRYAEQSLARYTRASIFRISNAVSEIYFAAQRRKTEPKFMFVGSVYPLKGVLDFVRATQLLDRAGYAARIVIVGPVHNERYFQEICREAHFRNCQFQYAGLQSPSWIAKQFENTLALVHPSHAENAPMAVAEALASGVPVIGTGVGAIPEWIHSGKNGWVVPVQDVKAIAIFMAFTS